MKPYAEKFYKSKAWRQCRDSYAKAAGGLCERCLAKGIFQPGIIVHHKIEITPETIDDPNITLNWNNLEFVCRDCHAELHSGKTRRYQVDELGRVLL